MEMLWVAVALGAPWALGSSVAHYCLAARQRLPASLVLGIGFPFGMYLMAGATWLTLRLGMGLPARPLLILVLITVGIYWWLQIRGNPLLTGRQSALISSRLVPYVLMLLATLFLVAPLIVDVSLRPLFPWDAWFSYGIKAKIIAHLDRLPELVTYSDWRQAWLPGQYYISETHPLTISLIQAFMAGAIGRWSESLINLPWPILLFSLALISHGAISIFCQSRSLAALAFILILTVPAYGVHAVLAGYLDLWLATWLAISATTVCLWLHCGGWQLGLMAAMSIAGCMYSKDTAIAYLLPLAFGTLLALLPRFWRLIATVISVVLLIAGMSYFALNPEPSLYLPLGSESRIGFVDGVFHAPFVKNYELIGPNPVWPRLAESLLFSRNFLILGWLLFAAALVAFANLHRSANAAVLAGFLVGTIAVLHFTLGYTRAGRVLAQGTIDLRLLIPITATAATIALCFAGEMLDKAKNSHPYDDFEK